MTTPLTDAADDVTMRYSARFERVRDLCRKLEGILRERCLAPDACDSACKCCQRRFYLRDKET